MEHNTTEAYVYQPDPPRGNGKDQRIYGVGGPCTGAFYQTRFTKSEAEELVRIISQGKAAALRSEIIERAAKEAIDLSCRPAPDPNRPNLMERTWQEFQEAGLLWWINRTLHLFGWAIVFETDLSEIKNVYPARCRYRGYEPSGEEDGFKKLTNHLELIAQELKQDCE